MLKINGDEIEFIFVEHSTRKYLFSEKFKFTEAEQIAKDILKMIKKDEKQSRCF